MSDTDKNGHVSDGWSVAEAMPRWQFVLDAVVAAAFAVVLAGIMAARHQWTWLPLVGLLALALALRHRHVWLMIGLSVLAGLVQLFLTDVAYPADAAFAVLFFGLGSHARRVLRVTGLGCAVLATVVAGWYTVFQSGGGEPTETMWAQGAVFALGTAVVTLGGWTVGYIQWLNRRAMQAGVDARLDAAERRRLQDAIDQEQERSRIATDMHDVVAHSWAVVAAQADGARYSIGKSPESTERALEVIGETARSTIADIRVILARLRYQEPSGTTPKAIPGAEQQRQLFARMRASGMQLDDTETGASSNSPLIVMTAHRLLSEALTNALKHGDLDAPVEVRQDWSEGYRLRVVNSLSDREGSVGAGHGIIGMRERATLAGGVVTSSHSDGRWVVAAYLPEPDHSESEHLEEGQ